MAIRFKPSVSSERLSHLKAIQETGDAGADPQTLGIRPEEIFQVAIHQIRQNPYQPRSHYSEDSLAELASSLREHGLLQPVVGRPNPDGSFTLVAGHRRWMASQKAGLETIKLISREATDEELRLLAVIENIQREDLHAVDKVRALADIAGQFSTQSAAAKAVGMKRTALAQWLRAHELGQEVLDTCSRIPDLSLKALIRMVKLPAHRHLSEARRLFTFSQKPEEPQTVPKRLPASANTRQFVFHLPEKRFTATIEVRAKTRKHRLTREDYRRLLLLALRELEDETSYRGDIPVIY